jgi:hypothetical protein
VGVGATVAAVEAGQSVPAVDPAAVEEAVVDDRVARVPAAERRRGALALLEVWRAVVRDLGLVVAGDREAVRDRDLVDDLRPAAARLSTPAVGAALGRIDVAAERLEGNVSPELVLDVLAIHWAPAGRP